MRILHLLATGMHGGAATAAITLARLQQQWEEVTLVLPRRHSLDQEVMALEQAGVAVMPLDLKFQRRLGGWWAYLQALRSEAFRRGACPLTRSYYRNVACNWREVGRDTLGGSP